MQPSSVNDFISSTSSPSDETGSGMITDTQRGSSEAASTAIDVLTMSATPIPRTLRLALAAATPEIGRAHV